MTPVVCLPARVRGGYDTDMITLSRLKQLLREAGVQFLQDKTTLVSPFVQNGRQMFNLFIDLHDKVPGSGYSYIRFRVPFLAVADNSSHREAVLREAMALNLKWRYAKLCLDTEDFEISAEVDLPVMDAEPTALQISRCTGALLCLVSECQPALRQLAETGVHPSINIDETLARLFADAAEPEGSDEDGSAAEISDGPFEGEESEE